MKTLFALRTTDESTYVRVPTETYERLMTSHLQRKVNRAAVAVRRMTEALGKQKAQTADDQRYIDLLEAQLTEPTLVAIRAQMATVRIHTKLRTKDTGHLW